MSFDRPPGDSMDWFDVLEACRTFDRSRPFRASELQLKVEFKSTEIFEHVRGAGRKVSGSSGLQRASSWCSKLVQMKLLEDRGEIPPMIDPATGEARHEHSGRVPHLYSVTDKGWKLKAKPLSRLDRLLAAVRQLQAAAGKPQEVKLYQQLFAVAQAIEKELADGKKKAGGRE